MVTAHDNQLIAREIWKYIRDTEKVPDMILSNYKYELIFDGAVFINDESRRSDVKILRKVLGSNPCSGNNFQKIYSQIAIIAHIIWATKRVEIPEAVTLAIDLYRDIYPDNYAIYEIHSNSVKEIKAKMRVIVFTLIILVLHLIWETTK